MSELGVEPVGVKTIATDLLHPNPHNPRMLFDRQPMQTLLESIKRVGILVPLTVYQEGRTKKFIILDGQRRWMCAQQAGLREVPVNQVAEPTLVQNIVTMFQIHKLREDWELMPTALKVELLMREVNDRNEKRLAELTGLDEAVIVRCKKLLSYDKSFQDKMLDPDPEKRIKADFFIELYPVVHDRDVRRLDWFKEKAFVTAMLNKYQAESKPIKAVTDFRLVKQHITNARKANAFKRLAPRLKSFVTNVDAPLDVLKIEEIDVSAEAKSLSRKVSALRSLIEALDVEHLYGEEALWSELDALARVIEKKLRQANKRR